MPGENLSENGFPRIKPDQQAYKAVAAESCQCVSCVMCSGKGRIRVDHWSGYDTEPCEDCENGISEVCGRCEYLADLDRELFCDESVECGPHCHRTEQESESAS